MPSDFTCTGTNQDAGQVLALQLNAAALADINARLGGRFAVGFSLDDTGPNGAVFNSALKGIRFRADFGETRIPVADLVLQSAPVPEPGSLSMVALAALGLVISSIRAEARRGRA